LERRRRAFDMSGRWGEMIDGLKTYDCHEGQSAVISSDARFVAAIAGTGGGKTALGPLWVMREMDRIRKLRPGVPIVGFCVAPTYDVLARATAPTLVHMFRDTIYEGEYFPSRRQYELPNGWGSIWMLSADRPGGLEGGQIDFAWIDEGGQLKYDAWVAITGRCGVKMSRILITTTPYLRNWLYYKFLRLWQQGDPMYFVRQWSSITNPAYPVEEFERAKRDMTAQRFAQRHRGEFVKMSGLVYPDIDQCRQRFSTIPNGEHFGGIDFGWNDPFSCHVAVLDREDILWVYRERYKRRTPIEVHARALPRDPTYFADATRPDQIARLNTLGLTVKPNRVKEIVAGIDMVNTRIYANKLIIHDECTAVWTEANEYAYETDEDVQESGGEKPVGGFDHAMDDIRYLVANIDRRRKLKSAA